MTNLVRIPRLPIHYYLHLMNIHVYIIKICKKKKINSLSKPYDEKIRNKIWHAVGKMDTPSTEIHDLPLSWLGTGTAIKSGGAKLVLKDMFCLS